MTLQEFQRYVEGDEWNLGFNEFIVMRLKTLSKYMAIFLKNKKILDEYPLDKELIDKLSPYINMKDSMKQPLLKMPLEALSRIQKNDHNIMNKIYFISREATNGCWLDAHEYLRLCTLDILYLINRLEKGKEKKEEKKEEEYKEPPAPEKLKIIYISRAEVMAITEDLKAQYTQPFVKTSSDSDRLKLFLNDDRIGEIERRIDDDGYNVNIPECHEFKLSLKIGRSFVGYLQKLPVITLSLDECNRIFRAAAVKEISELSIETLNKAFIEAFSSIKLDIIFGGLDLKENSKVELRIGDPLDFETSATEKLKKIIPTLNLKATENLVVEYEEKQIKLPLEKSSSKLTLIHISRSEMMAIAENLKPKILDNSLLPLKIDGRLHEKLKVFLNNNSINYTSITERSDYNGCDISIDENQEEILNLKIKECHDQYLENLPKVTLSLEECNKIFKKYNIKEVTQLSACPLKEAFIEAFSPRKIDIILGSLDVVDGKVVIKIGSPLNDGNSAITKLQRIIQTLGSSKNQHTEISLEESKKMSNPVWVNKI